MLNTILVGLMVYFAPIPWLIVLTHIYTLRGKSARKLLFLITPISWLVLGLTAYYYIPLISVELNSDPKYLVAGGIVLIVALIIEILSRKELGGERIMGSSEFSGNEDKLVTTGIYKFARHPRHVEHPLWFLGLGLLFAHTILLWFAAYLFLGLVVSTIFEEKELLHRYGKEYISYKKRTPAFFIGP